MKEFRREAVGNLLTVKSIVTLVLTLVFSVLAVTSRIDGGQFLNIFSIVIAFYFGTQHRKSMTQEVTQEKGDAERRGMNWLHLREESLAHLMFMA